MKRALPALSQDSGQVWQPDYSQIQATYPRTDPSLALQQDLPPPRAPFLPHPAPSLQHQHLSSSWCHSALHLLSNFSLPCSRLWDLCSISSTQLCAGMHSHTVLNQRMTVLARDEEVKSAHLLPPPHTVLCRTVISLAILKWFVFKSQPEKHNLGVPSH